MARSHHDGPADAGPDLLPLRSAAAGISLQPVLESLVSTILTEYEGRGRGGVTVSIDAEVDVAAASVAGLTDLLTPLVAAACEAAATAPERLREVIITAVQTATTLEIEVADSAPPPAVITARLPAVSSHSPAASAAISITVTVQTEAPPSRSTCHVAAQEAWRLEVPVLRPPTT